MDTVKVQVHQHHTEKAASVPVATRAAAATSCLVVATDSSIPQPTQMGSQLAAQNKRKEKARIAARARRSQEASIIMEMANELHITQEKIRRIDKATIVKLAIDYIKAFEILCRFRSGSCDNNFIDESINNNINNNGKNDNITRRRNSISQVSSNRENSCISKRNNYDLVAVNNDNNETCGDDITKSSNHRHISTISNNSIQATGIDISIVCNCDHEAGCNKYHQHNNTNEASNCITPIVAQQQQQQLRQQQPLRPLSHTQNYTEPIDIVSSRHRVYQTQPMPKVSTGSIFAPKTDDMDSYFLMINDRDGRPSFVLKPDNEILEEDDLTHLAPQAGDSSISLEVEPLDGIVLDTSLFNSGSPPMKKAPMVMPTHHSLMTTGHHYEWAPSR